MGFILRNAVCIYPSQTAVEADFLLAQCQTTMSVGIVLQSYPLPPHGLTPARCGNATGTSHIVELVYGDISRPWYSAAGGG